MQHENPRRRRRVRGGRARKRSRRGLGRRGSEGAARGRRRGRARTRPPHVRRPAVFRRHVCAPRVPGAGGGSGPGGGGWVGEGAAQGEGWVPGAWAGWRWGSVRVVAVNRGGWGAGGVPRGTGGGRWGLRALPPTELRPLVRPTHTPTPTAAPRPRPKPEAGTEAGPGPGVGVSGAAVEPPDRPGKRLGGGSHALTAHAGLAAGTGALLARLEMRPVCAESLTSRHTNPILLMQVRRWPTWKHYLPPCRHSHPGTHTNTHTPTRSCPSTAAGRGPCPTHPISPTPTGLPTRRRPPRPAAPAATRTPSATLNAPPWAQDAPTATPAAALVGKKQLYASLYT